MLKNAYVTVLSTENYLKGVIGLFESLKLTNPKYNNYVVVVNEKINNETISILESYGYLVIKRKSIFIPETVLSKNNKLNMTRWNYTFDKFNIFELTEFDKIIYLDSDMYIARNIDELFECKDMSCVAAGQSMKGNEDWINLNSGLMVIEPKKELIREFIKILQEANFGKNIGDQDVLEEYFSWHTKPELKLPEKYNIFATYIDYYINELNYKLENIAVVHFTGEIKPWMMNESEKKEFIEKCVNNNLKYELYFFKKYLDIIDNS